MSHLIAARHCLLQHVKLDGEAVILSMQLVHAHAQLQHQQQHQQQKQKQQQQQQLLLHCHCTDIATLR
jgi:arginine exporter protein ArgO